jgi:hypothetical protein
MATIDPSEPKDSAAEPKPAPAQAEKSVSDNTQAESSAAGDSKPADPMDPIGWEVPLICKDCNEAFKVPYRHFQPGVVFYCPKCSGSFVPNSTIYRTVRDAFEDFYSGLATKRAEFEKRGANELFKTELRLELEDFRLKLEEIARQMRPAGKLVRKKGLAAMFT